MYERQKRVLDEGLPLGFGALLSLWIRFSRQDGFVVRLWAGLGISRPLRVVGLYERGTPHHLYIPVVALCTLKLRSGIEFHKRFQKGKEYFRAMDAERLNSPSTSAISVEAFGHQLQFSQDPNSKHLGTTVWDASMVFVKFLERNSRKGRFCPSKLRGKRVIELGAGCGVAGFGMAMLGCNVVATDQVEVLPLLMRNVERNTSRVMQTDPSSDSFGSITAAELDWGNGNHIRAIDPPFDYIIGTDVVYAEHLLELLLQTIFALSGPRTTIMVGYEIRSTSVHKQMLDMWKRHFEVKTVPKAKMDSKYQHPSIQLYIMGLKPSALSMINVQPSDEVETGDELTDKGENCGSSDAVDNMNDCGPGKVIEDSELGIKPPNGKLSDWEARRFGSMAARLLRDVTIT